MMDLRERVIALNTTRMKVWEEGKRLLDDTAGREMSGEERQTWDRINTRINDIDSEVRSLVDRETRDKEAGELREMENRIFGAPAPTGNSRTPEQNLRAFVNGEFSHRGHDDATSGRRYIEVDVRTAMKEKQLLRAGASAEEIRALAWDTGSVASAVPTTLAREMYGYMEYGIAGFRIGATHINTNSGENIDFPRVNAHAIATQVSGHGTALAGTDPTFAKMTLSAYKYGELVKVASEVLQDSGIDIAAFLGRDIGRALSRKIDVDLVTGAGSTNPQGLMTAVTVGANGTVSTGGTTTGLLTYGSLVAVVYGVNDAYRQSPSAGWLMHDLTAGAIRQMRDGAGGTLGAALWQPSLFQGMMGGQPDKLLGFPVFTDPNVASIASNAKILAFGDFSAYYLRTVGNPVIETDSSRYFDTDEIGFRGKWRVDGDYIDLTAVTLLKNSV
jgi:HK97 family phage major capsid protein